MEIKNIIRLAYDSIIRRAEADRHEKMPFVFNVFEIQFVYGWNNLNVNQLGFNALAPLRRSEHFY